MLAVGSIEEALNTAGAEDDLQTILQVLEGKSVGFKRQEAAAGPFASMDTTMLTALNIRMLSIIKRAQQQQQQQHQADTTGPSGAWRAQFMAEVKALVNRPSVLSTTTLQKLGYLANKRAKVEVPLPPTYALDWDSPIWAHVTSSSVQLIEADKDEQKGLQSLFADLLPTAPSSTPFVFYDVHTRPSVCGSDLKPDVVMGLRDKPCIPLTTAAIIHFKRQGGGYDNDENIGKAITYGRVFLQQLPRTLRKMGVVGLADLQSITLVLVRLDADVDGAEQLSYEMSTRLPNVKHTLLQLLSCEPQRWFVELPELGPSIQVVGLLGSGATSHVYEASKDGHQVVAKVPFIRNLSEECSVLQALQGIPDVPMLQ